MSLVRFDGLRWGELMWLSITLAFWVRHGWREYLPIRLSTLFPRHTAEYPVTNFGAVSSSGQQQQQQPQQQQQSTPAVSASSGQPRRTQDDASRGALVASRRIAGAAATASAAAAVPQSPSFSSGLHLPSSAANAVSAGGESAGVASGRVSFRVPCQTDPPFPFI